MRHYYVRVTYYIDTGDESLDELLPDSWYVAAYDHEQDAQREADRLQEINPMFTYTVEYI